MDTFECVSSVLEACGSVKQARQAGHHHPIWHGLCVSKHEHEENLETFGNVWERFGAS